MLLLTFSWLFYVNYIENKVKREMLESIKNNPYFELRAQSINMTLKQLGLESDPNDDLYGIVMDWSMKDVIATVVSFKTGDASLYLSSGQIFIGGYSHESILNASIEFINLGKKFLSKAKKIESNVQIKEDKVYFHFLTESGRYYIVEEKTKIDDKSSDILDLFHAANEIITEYRILSKK